MTDDLLALFAKWRFLLLTLLICAWQLTTPHIAGNWPIQLLLEALLLATVLVTLSANPGWRRLRQLLAVLWLVSMAGTVLSVLSPPDGAWQWYRTLEQLTLVPVIAAVAVGMLAFVGRERTLTVDNLFATVAAYLLLAMLFTQIYLCLLTWNPASFSLPVPAAGRPYHLLQSDMTYFSLVTLATVGYGDILPVTPTARMLAMIQAVVGQFYVAVIVAVFVGMYASRRRD
jgi:voltage-gated potassium channel